MAEDLTASSKRVLEPIERVSEILFGLIMVLAITGSFSIAESGQESVRSMLIAALGCNLAWGIIDGALYLMACLAERGRNLATLLAVRHSTNPQEVRPLIAAALPPLVASVMQPAELDAIHARLRELPEPSPTARLARDDWMGFLGVFLLVFLSTLPVALPFLLVRETALAMRVSRVIGIAMLFLTGHLFGRAAGRNPWTMGMAMVLLGSALIGLTIALGG